MGTSEDDHPNRQIDACSPDKVQRLGMVGPLACHKTLIVLDESEQPVSVVVKEETKVAVAT